MTGWDPDRFVVLQGTTPHNFNTSTLIMIVRPPPPSRLATSCDTSSALNGGPETVRTTPDGYNLPNLTLVSLEQEIWRRFLPHS